MVEPMLHYDWAFVLQHAPNHFQLGWFSNLLPSPLQLSVPLRNRVFMRLSSLPKDLSS
jgi:hypothetical protein